jgi:acyl-[acyl carrier protein]--UDP-N-acetylglucosamine O-acyltransferase
MWNKVGTNKIHSTAIVEDNVIMGNYNTIYPYAVIGLPGFIRNSENANGIVIIGNNNKIGSHASIQCGLSGETKIGDDNLIMNYVNIGHDTVIGSNNEIGAGSIVAGWVVVGNNNKIKLNVTIRNRIKIGNNNIVGMSSNVVCDIGSNKMLYGNPSKVVKDLI